MSGWINFNGSLMPDTSPVFTAASRAFRYGDGLFETMRAEGDRIILGELHFQRLFAGLSQLKIRTDASMTAAWLEKEITRTLSKNRINTMARVRLSIFRGEGGVNEPDGPGRGFLIQVWPLAEKRRLNENGLVVGLYPDATKSCDPLSNLKTNNYLVYVMAALYSKEKKWNESLVLNTHQRICDATIANIFWVENGTLFTPPLSEGGIAGVMRRHLLETLPAKGFAIGEEPIDVNRLQQADEVFLTNAISGIRWVKEFGEKTYAGKLSNEIFYSTF